jgi:hypothetical protein
MQFKCQKLFNLIKSAPFTERKEVSFGATGNDAVENDDGNDSFW